jgi:hypothetical protein
MNVGINEGFLEIVTPAKAGVQCFCHRLIFLDTGFRRYDIRAGFSTSQFTEYLTNFIFFCKMV